MNPRVARLYECVAGPCANLYVVVMKDLPLSREIEGWVLVFFLLDVNTRLVIVFTTLGRCKMLRMLCMFYMECWRGRCVQLCAILLAYIILDKE